MFQNSITCLSLLFILGFWSCRAGQVEQSQAKIVLRGQDLNDVTANMTRGTISWGQQCAYSTVGSWQGHAELDGCDRDSCEMLLDREYKLTTSLFSINAGNSYTSLSVKVAITRSNPSQTLEASYVSDNPIPFVGGKNYTLIVQQEVSSALANNDGNPTWTVTVDVRTPLAQPVVCEKFNIKLSNSGPFSSLSGFLMVLVIATVTLPRLW